MNSPIQGNIERGALICVVTLPDPWPPTLNGLFVEQRLVGGVARLGGNTEGKIFLELAREPVTVNSVFMRLESMPLVGSAGSPAAFIARWSPDAMFIRCNGTYIANTEGHADGLTEYVLPSHLGSANLVPGRYDNFSGEDAKALAKRRGRHTSRQTIPQRIPGSAVDMFAALQDEILQVTEIVQLIQAGKLHHVRGLASRLRMLVAEGRPQPLLQSCAGYLDVPLRVHTDLRPKSEIPIPVISGISLNLKYRPTALMPNPLDLDSWLGLRAVVIGKSQYTNRDILKHAGNTIGSHFDHDMLPTMAVLRSADVGNAELHYDLLIEFIVKVAEEILPLCADVHRRYEATLSWPPTLEAS